MKVKLLFFSALSYWSLNAHQAFAQQLTGRVYYKASNQLILNMDSTEMNPDQLAEMKAMMEKPWERDYILSFTQTESNWQQVENLESSPSTTPPGEMTIMLSGSGDEILYKNIAEQVYLQEQEFMGKEFLIKDALEPVDWKLSDETKKIGDYTVQKATYTKVEDSQRFSTGMTEMENVKDTILVTVWFAPEIPVAHGPENYYGLPGLILEVHNDGRSYYCEKIELNPSAEPVAIEYPKGGKEVTFEEFNTNQEESIKLMMNRYQGKPGGKNRTQIRVGG
ncbi:MAG: GLPGLI family protein [Algoriphagus sp.]|nr:GLPGLI family protein [Algoriphagus sp.]